MATPLRKIVRALYPRRPAGEKPGKQPGRNGARFSWGRFFLILLAVLFVAKIGLLFLYYNAFLSMQYDVDEAAAQVDVQLQRRRNIILNLGTMVMNYAEHEKEIFTHATDMRTAMTAPRPGARPKRPPEQGQKESAPGAATDLESVLARVFAVAERYPDLRLSENFQRYMDALVDVETRIAEQRMVYNTRANVMSTAVDKFPGFIFAKIYGFEPPPFFEPEEEARKPLRVDY
jgi:LemA protein